MPAPFSATAAVFPDWTNLVDNWRDTDAEWLRNRTVIDLLTAAGFAILVLVELMTHMDDGYRTGAASWNLPILLGTVGSLAIRRRHTGLAILIGYSFVLVPSLFVAHTVFFFGTLMPLLVLTYTGARRLNGRAFSLALLAPALLLLVVPIHQPSRCFRVR